MNPKTLLISVAATAVLAAPGSALAAGAPAGVNPTSTPTASSNPASPSIPGAASGNTGSSSVPSGTSNPGSSHRPATPGPHSSLPALAKAYGKFCQNQSKKHIPGERGTPFSRCVTAMAKVAHDGNANPTSDCKTESKSHVAGEHGTAFSRCVSDAAKLHRDEQSQDAADSQPATPVEPQSSPSAS